MALCQLMETLGDNSSNGLCVRSVASKMSAQQAAKKIAGGKTCNHRRQIEIFQDHVDICTAEELCIFIVARFQSLQQRCSPIDCEFAKMYKNASNISTWSLPTRVS